MSTKLRAQAEKRLRRMGLSVRELLFFVSVTAVIAALYLLIALLLHLFSAKAVGGVLVGSAASIICFLHLAYSVLKLPEKGNAKGYYLFSYFLRLIILAAALIVGHLWLDLLATAVPILLSKLVYYCFGGVVSKE